MNAQQFGQPTDAAAHTSDTAKNEAGVTAATARDEAGVTAQTAKGEAAATAQTAKGEAAATAQTAQAEAAATAQTAQAEAKHVASTASSAAADVVGTTKEQAGNVATEALDQVRDLTDQLRVQLSEQAGTAATRLSQAVRSLAEELHDMGSNTGERSGAASQAAHSLAERGHRLADYLDGSDPDTLLADARTSAARKPGRFLLGAVVAGIVAGRLARGAKAAKDSGLGSTPAVSPTVTATPYPPVGTVESPDSVEYETVAPVAFGTAPGAHLGTGNGYDAPITSSADSALR